MAASRAPGYQCHIYAEVVHLRWWLLGTALTLSFAACSPEPATEIAMSFTRERFYDAPFPSDDLRTANGHIDLARLPDPDQPLLIQQTLALLAGTDGFAQTGAIYFRATAPQFVLTIFSADLSATIPTTSTAHM